VIYVVVARYDHEFPDADVGLALPHTLVEKKRCHTESFQKIYLRDYDFFGLILNEFLS